MKFNYSKKYLLASYLILTHQNHALGSVLNIENSNFDYQETIDGSAPTKVIGWRIETGLAGIYNPTESVFTGELNNGKHKNTLYLIDNAKVSQTLKSTVIPKANYTIKFDIGQRSDVELSSYTVTVKAEDILLLQATNPTFPAAAGEFARAEISFNSSDISSGLIKIEFESHDRGHVHFDNVELSYTQNNGRLGDWQHSDDSASYRVNIDYLAETDGFVVEYTSGTCNGNRETLILTNADGSQLQVARTVDYDSMMSPVKKGQKWRVNKYRSGSNCTSSIGFIPLNK